MLHTGRTMTPRERTRVVSWPERISTALVSLDTPPRVDEPEYIDDPDCPIADFRASMGDVRTANRLLGGTALVRREVARWLALRRDPGRCVTFLDIATGTADLPGAIFHTATRFGRCPRVVGLDLSEPIIRCAREEAPADVRLTRGNAFALPFSDNSVDYALCSLAFHHFGTEGALLALREMERVARYGWLVNDIRRSRSAWYLIRLITRLGGMNRLTRHDGPASVLRSYSISEYHAMPRALGLVDGTDYRLRRRLFYRVALVRDKPELS